MAKSFHNGSIVMMRKAKLATPDRAWLRTKYL
jgi:hypothetical protein